MKIKKIEKLVTNLHNKKRIWYTQRNLKQALLQGLVLKKVHRVIKFNHGTIIREEITCKRILL